MQLAQRIILPCGNTAILDSKDNTYRCNYCTNVIGSSDEPSDCKRKREEAEPFKNDYWMDINGGLEE